MLTDRIIKALTFRKEVYAEVEKDVEFTQTAWILVAVVAFLSQLGQYAYFGFGSIGRWLVSAVIGTVFAVGGFAIAAWAVSWVGKTLFKAEVDFGETVRTLGLAYIWNVVGVLGIVSAISVGLSCLLTPVTMIAALAGLVSWLFAIKEALDLDWGRTIATLLVGWVVSFAVTWVASFIVGLLGWSAAAAAGLS